MKYDYASHLSAKHNYAILIAGSNHIQPTRHVGTMMGQSQPRLRLRIIYLTRTYT